MISPDFILTSVKIPPLILHLDIMSCMDKSEEQKNITILLSSVLMLSWGSPKTQKFVIRKKLIKSM